MAVTKILARNVRVDVGINYVLNGDKTEERLLTSFQYCTPGNAYKRMMDTKIILRKRTVSNSIILSSLTSQMRYLLK